MSTHGLGESHWDLVSAIANQMYKKMGGWVDVEELMSWGISGLLEAAERYDPTRGVSFATYAYYRVRGAIWDGIRAANSMPPLTRSERLRAHRARVACRTVSTAYAPISEGPPLPEPRVVTEWDWFTRAEAVLSGAPLDTTEVHDTCPYSVIASRLMSALRALPEREQHLIYQCYYEGKTVTDAGKELGLSKSGSCRMHARALARLRRLLRIDDL